MKAPAAHASSLLGASDFSLTIFFDLKVTQHEIRQLIGGQTVRKYHLNRTYESHSFTFHSSEAHRVSWKDSRLYLEMYNGWRYDVLKYDFDTARGTLDFGDNVGWVDRYTFYGSKGDHWYETDNDPNYETKRSLLKQTLFLMTVPGDPIPLSAPHPTAIPTPATLPLLITALAGATVLRRRRCNRD